MKEDTCILCGRTFPAGLHIMGCLICFPCEKRMLWNELAPTRRRGLCRLYDASAPTVCGGQNVSEQKLSCFLTEGGIVEAVYDSSSKTRSSSGG